jgi:hypothetical protein
MASAWRIGGSIIVKYHRAASAIERKKRSAGMYQHLAWRFSA